MLSAGYAQPSAAGTPAHAKPNTNNNVMRNHCAAITSILVLAACAIPPLLLLRVKKPWLAVCGFCLVVNLAEILPWYLPQANIPSASSAEVQLLRVLLANVLSSNRRYPEVISLIRAEQPDLAVLLEI